MSSKKNIVIGIGLSAGGLDSLQKFFSSLNEPFSPSIVIVQNFDAEGEIILPGLIQKMTPLVVEKISDGMILSPSKIYILPSDRGIIFSENRIYTIPNESGMNWFFNLDNFFSTIADNFGENAAGILMSKIGSGEIMGLEKIKSRGGIVIAQDPDSAKYVETPESVVKNGVFDKILPPEKMPGCLAEYFKYLEAPKPLIDPDSVKEIIKILLEKTGHDFSNYKISTISRRIKRQAALKKTASIDDYIKLIRSDDMALHALFRNFLIGVTAFFRDKDAFDELEKSAVQAIISGRGRKNEPIRIWIPGCSTGEETYSIAILFMKQMKILKKNIPLQIFASDIDKTSIETARRRQRQDFNQQNSA